MKVSWIRTLRYRSVYTYLKRQMVRNKGRLHGCWYMKPYRYWLLLYSHFCMVMNDPTARLIRSDILIMCEQESNTKEKKNGPSAFMLRPNFDFLFTAVVTVVSFGVELIMGIQTFCIKASENDLRVKELLVPLDTFVAMWGSCHSCCRGIWGWSYLGSKLFGALDGLSRAFLIALNPNNFYKKNPRPIITCYVYKLITIFSI